VLVSPEPDEADNLDGRHVAALPGVSRRHHDTAHAVICGYSQSSPERQSCAQS
jgi:hypothetical protein